jgi:hypothetical protein
MLSRTVRGSFREIQNWSFRDTELRKAKGRSGRRKGKKDKRVGPHKQACLTPFPRQSLVLLAK